MSNWTHVAGIVRVDGLRRDDYREKTIRDIFGKHFDYNDPDEVRDDAYNHPEEYLPFGSEGCLDIDVLENPDKHSVAAYVVVIHGDLRDHDSSKCIIEWFKTCVENLWVRQAVITVYNEYENKHVSWTYEQ